MKTTFTTVDLLAIVAELKNSVVGMRVVQVYDIDSKTYLFKLQKPEQKCMLLMESGSRIHTTEYEWPKSPAPSGFSMKMRKHLRNKRIESITQLGVDRILDLQFGIGEAEHHVILELYDRGNIVLTDSCYTILNILRPRREGEDVRFAVHEKYPVENSRKVRPALAKEDLINALNSGKENAPLKKILLPLLDCGGGVLDHELLEVGFPNGIKLTTNFRTEENVNRLHTAAVKAQSVVAEWGKRPSEGYIVKKIEKRKGINGTEEEVPIYQGFMPILFIQHAKEPLDKYTSFNQACDEYFSKMEAAKIDQHALQHEKEALKKLEKVKLDHERRLKELTDRQRAHEEQGHLIELNKDLVDGAIRVVRTLVANQIDWRQIHELLSEAQGQGDPVALTIKSLKLEESTLTLLLSNPFDCDEDDLLLDSDEEREEGRDDSKMRPMLVDIDLEHSAMANARKYFNQKRQAAQKEQKTLDATAKVVQVTTKKTNQALKESAAITNIIKARKVLWFEKFLWFVTSENYLVLAGRDMQMNEMLVKRHLRPHDIYVHADMHGAPSVVIKNPAPPPPSGITPAPLPPKTLHEAGIMALCYSRAWDEKVVTSAWWVWGHQVSKTAPSGEYLTTGAFMVRGKKNFLPPSHLVYGFGFLFRLEEDSIARHAGERRVRTLEEEGIPDQEKQKDLPLLEEEEPLEEEEETKVKEEESNVQKPETTKTEHDSDNDKEDSDVSVKGEEEEEEKSEELEFPDTKVEMSYITGDQFSIRTKTFSTSSQISQQSGGTAEDEDERVVYLGDDQPVTVPRRRKDSTNSNTKGAQPIKKPEKIVEQDGESQESGSKGAGALKRGQKGKNKKIKKKYQDQDDEEREMRMQLLQSAGIQKEAKKSKGGKKGGKSVKVKGSGAPRPNPTNPQASSLTPATTTSTPVDITKANHKKDKPDEEEEEEEVQQVADDLNILNALTAIPSPEDELLYAIPVCAPYTTMANYRFKVKMTPGPGKKGKACKTALTLFLGDKTTSSREKDLLRAVRDQDLSRNLPGKVKVSAPNISKLRK